MNKRIERDRQADVWVTVQCYDQDEQRQFGHVTGIFSSAEQARQAATAAGNGLIEAHRWDSLPAPRLWESVRVLADTAVPYRRPGLLDLINAMTKRLDVEKLQRENEALRQHNHGLSAKLNGPEPLRHPRLSKSNENFQTKNLWIGSDLRQAQDSMLADFDRAERPSITDRVMVAPDEAVVHFLNRQTQENRRQFGAVKTGYGLAHDRCLLHVGDRVVLSRPDADLDLRANDLGQILHINPAMRTIAVALDRRQTELDQVAFIPLREYPHVDLGYALTYDQTADLKLRQAFVLADGRADAPELVERIEAQRVEIYADRITAHRQFANLIAEPEPTPNIDPQADPLALYHQER